MNKIVGHFFGILEPDHNGVVFGEEGLFDNQVFFLGFEHEFRLVLTCHHGEGSVIGRHFLYLYYVQE